MKHVQDISAPTPSQALANLEKSLEKPEGLTPSVDLAWEIIQTDYARLESVAQVAKFSGVNYHTLRRKFRRQTRLTLESCLAIRRVLAAVELIQTTGMLIKEVAWEVGYDQEHQLTRAVKRRLGFTPQVLRGNTRLSGIVDSSTERARALICSNSLPKKDAHI